MIATIFKGIGGLLIAGVLVIGMLSGVKGAPSMEIANKNTLAKAYMEKNKDSYAKCYNSINYGSSTIGSVSMSYLTYNTDEATKAKLKALETSYAAKIKDQCQKQVEEYETSFSDYKSTSEEIAVSSQSLLDKMLGGKPETDSADLRQYDPPLVRLMSGSAFTNTVFTEQEVKDYFKQELGN
jgi:hypothetical protein